jgi:transcriptional/translational regulatory protein YebC/TACO1
MGVMYYAPDVPEEALLEAALEAGAEDMVVAGDGSREVLVQPDQLDTTRQALEKAGFPPAEVELGPHPLAKVAVDEEHAATVERLLADLDQLDDVQAVYSNAEFGLSVTG